MVVWAGRPACTVAWHGGPGRSLLVLALATMPYILSWVPLPHATNTHSLVHQLWNGAWVRWLRKGREQGVPGHDFAWLHNVGRLCSQCLPAAGGCGWRFGCAHEKEVLIAARVFYALGCGACVAGRAEGPPTTALDAGHSISLRNPCVQ